MSNKLNVFLTVSTIVILHAIAIYFGLYLVDGFHFLQAGTWVVFAGFVLSALALSSLAVDTGDVKGNRIINYLIKISGFATVILWALTAFGAAVGIWLNPVDWTHETKPLSEAVQYESYKAQLSKLKHYDGYAVSATLSDGAVHFLVDKGGQIEIVRGNKKRVVNIPSGIKVKSHNNLLRWYKHYEVNEEGQLVKVTALGTSEKITHIHVHNIETSSSEIHAVEDMPNWIDGVMGHDYGNFLSLGNKFPAMVDDRLVEIRKTDGRLEIKDYRNLTRTDYVDYLDDEEVAADLVGQIATVERISSFRGTYGDIYSITTDLGTFKADPSEHPLVTNLKEGDKVKIETWKMEITELKLVK